MKLKINILCIVTLGVILLWVVNIPVFSRGFLTGRTESKEKISNSEAVPSLATQSTVDCVSWQPVEVLEHNMKGPGEREEGGVREKLLDSESSDHRRESFAKVYDNNEWGAGGIKSGRGSLLRNAKQIIQVLNNLVEKMKEDLGKEQISLLDSSCGDMTWMPTFLGNRTDVIFTGYDIVPANIENHKKKFALKNWNFEVHDSVVDAIPRFDLILSRHTMMHIKTIDVAKLLKNFHDSGSPYLLATNFPEIKSNAKLSENSLGRWRSINLHLEPFFLPPPVCQSDKDGDHRNQYIAFWELDKLGTLLHSL